MKPTGKAIVSLMLTAEMLLGSAWMAGPAVAASVQSGTPYTADGQYNVKIPHIIVNQVYGGVTLPMHQVDFSRKVTLNYITQLIPM